MTKHCFSIFLIFILQTQMSINTQYLLVVILFLIGQVKYESLKLIG